MKQHTKLYMSAFGFDTSDHIPCECCGSKAVDINHHPARGMGGTTREERIESLIAMCRKHHLDYADKKQFAAWLFKVHLQHMNQHGVKFDRDWIDEQIKRHEHI